jgi:hypothetical protein
VDGVGWVREQNTVINMGKKKGAKKGKTIQKVEQKAKKVEKQVQQVKREVAKEKKVIKNAHSGAVSASLRKVIGNSLTRPHPKAVAIARAIANPSSCSYLRLVSDPCSIQPTSALTLHRIQSAINTSCMGTYTQVPSGTMYMAIFRSVLRSAVVFIPNPGAVLTVPLATSYQYDALFYDSSTTETQVTQSLNESLDVIDVQPLYFSANSANTWSPHGTRFYCGLNAGKRYVWLDKTNVVTFTTAVNVTIDLNVYQFSGQPTEEPSPFLTIALVAVDTAVFTAVNAGYYRFSFTFDGAVPVSTTFSMSIVGNGDVFAHLPLLGVENHISYLRQYRVNAGSMLVAPTMADFSKNGDIFGICSSSNQVQWYSNLTFSDWSNQSNVQAYYFFSRAGRGGYTFLRPSKIDDDFSYRDDSGFTTPTGGASCLGYHLNSTSFYSAFAVQTTSTAIAGSSTTYASACNFLLTVVHSIEFVAPDQWVEAKPPSSEYKDVIAAMEIVAPMMTFYENPLHLKQIGEFLGKGYNWIRKNTGTIAKGIGALFPHLRGVTDPFAGIMDLLPEL